MKSIYFKVRAACAVALCSSAWLAAHATALDVPPQVVDSVATASEEANAPVAVQVVATAPASAETPVVAGWGEPVALGQLDDFRGGADLVKNDMQLSGTVANNSATHVISGNNAISDDDGTQALLKPLATTRRTRR